LIWRKANVKEAKIVDLIQNLKNQVKPLGKKIVLPEYQDERVLVATEIILKEGFCTPVLVGNPAEIAEAAKAAGVSIEGAEIIDPANYDRYQEMVDTFVELRAKKGMTPEKADATMKGDCLFFGAMLVRLGAVDGMVAGSATPTASVLRAALQVVGTKPGLKTVSSTMVMFTDKKEYAANLIIVATGVKPNTEFLKDSGIELFKNGAIIINRFGETNIPNVYAAGDCATVYHSVLEKNVYIALATTANKLGRLIGENLTGANKKFMGTLGSAGIKVLEFEAGRTGITEQEAKDNNINYKSVFVKGKDHTAYYPDREDVYIKLIYNADTKILLGAQVAGKRGAALRADALAVAIQNRIMLF